MQQGKTIEDLIEDFALLDNWEDQITYAIELGKSLPPFPEDLRTEDNKVQGCTALVWLVGTRRDGPNGPILEYQGDSNAHIQRGLVAILLTLFSGKTADEILKTDALAIFRQIGLEGHLTPQRSNGLRSMVERIRADAAAVRAAA
ncbi:SufE family protein [Xanthobacteraceae bacterium A53D]